MTSPQRLRVVTPELLDALVANLVNTSSTSTSTAVANHAGTGTATVSGSVSATASSLMQRDANGRSQVATPAVSADIATKGYVDTVASNYVLATDKGSALGVASLDSTAKIPLGQISASFPRNLGSGTAFPTGINLGDLFTHTGLGGAFRWDGVQWAQLGRITVTNRAARDALLSTYGAQMPLGFTVVQSDYRWVWRKDQGGWVLAGFDGGSSYYPASGNLGSSFKYTALNRTVPFNTWTQAAGWSFEGTNAASTEREIITYNSAQAVFTVNDRCTVNVQAYAVNDLPGFGSSTVRLHTPAGTSSFPSGVITDIRHRGYSGTTGGGYPGNGTVGQSLSWTGPCDAGSTFWCDALQYNTNSGNPSINFNWYLAVTLLSS